MMIKIGHNKWEKDGLEALWEIPELFDKPPHVAAFDSEGQNMMGALMYKETSEGYMVSMEFAFPVAGMLIVG